MWHEPLPLPSSIGVPGYTDATGREDQSPPTLSAPNFGVVLTSPCKHHHRSVCPKHPLLDPLMTSSMQEHDPRILVQRVVQFHLSLEG